MTDQGIILAAGLGTRLGWLTENRPKALMPIAGVPVIVRVIRRMAAAGIRHIAINVHHHAALLQSVLANGQQFGVCLYYSVEQQLLDSGGGVRQALLQLPSIGPVLVHNADIVSTIALPHLQRSAHKTDAVLALVKNPAHHPSGDFSLQQGRVSCAKGPRYTFSGVSFWQPDVLLAKPAATPFSLVDVMNEQMRKQRCAGLLHAGSWFDIGRPADLIQASRYIGTTTS